MKQMKYILSHMKSLPSFKKLEQSSYLNDLKNALPIKWKKYLITLYKKNSNLVFVFSHPAIESEFKYKKDLIMEMLQQIEKIHNISLNIKNIYSRCNHSVLKDNYSQKDNKQTIELYKEKSFGKFNNCLRDDILRDKFECVRNIILSRK